MSSGTAGRGYINLGPGPVDTSAPRDRSPAGTSSTEAKSPVSGEKITRPANAFILFRAEQVRLIKENEPELKSRPQSELSKIVGERWKTASAETRAIYDRRAEAAKTAFINKYGLGALSRGPRKSKNDAAASSSRNYQSPISQSSRPSHNNAQQPQFHANSSIASSNADSANRGHHLEQQHSNFPGGQTNRQYSQNQYRAQVDAADSLSNRFPYTAGSTSVRRNPNLDRSNALGSDQFRDSPEGNLSNDGWMNSSSPYPGGNQNASASLSQLTGATKPVSSGATYSLPSNYMPYMSQAWTPSYQAIPTLSHQFSHPSYQNSAYPPQHYNTSGSSQQQQQQLHRRPISFSGNDLRSPSTSSPAFSQSPNSMSENSSNNYLHPLGHGLSQRLNSHGAQRSAFNPSQFSPGLYELPSTQSNLGPSESGSNMPHSPLEGSLDYDSIGNYGNGNRKEDPPWED